MKARSWIASILTLILSTTGLAAQQGTNCQNMRADLVEARVTSGGTTVTCGFGIVVFGYELGLRGNPCPDYKFIYPAYHPCAVPSAGARCVFAGAIAVERRRCECIQYSFLGFGVSSPTCECENDGQSGAVYSYMTEECDSHPEARAR